ncbi:MAG: AAA family ATPase [Clostridiales bacterium]|nr:AAA family ATPase [Clostridiales bacterium]
MNIQEAKEEIVRSVRAYTAKDGQGDYRIPVSKQRPVFLLGPPGIGKTAIMEQAAAECGVGLLSYTITHHTRQSAVGLPRLVDREFEGREYTMTEYTMSEIIGAVYEYERQTGLREGILFIDEINCVSETLAPTMLQLLQFKTFGNHRVPDGWMIAAAGNPPEFNRSARELDLAVLDRVRTIEVEADWQIWRDYAFGRGVHPAVLSYLEMKPEYFYRVIQTREKQEFVTARGWEDLSVLLTEYERQGVEADRAFVEEFVRSPQIAADFASYYKLYRTYMGTYRIPELAEGRLGAREQEKLLTGLKEAGRDVRCIFVRHLLAAASEQMTAYGREWRYHARQREVLGQLSACIREKRQSADEFLEQRAHALEVRKEHGLLKAWEEQTEHRIDLYIRGLLCSPEKAAFLKELAGSSRITAEALPSSGLQRMERELEDQKRQLHAFLNRAADFLIQAFGEETELYDWIHGVTGHGDYALCGFERPEWKTYTGQREQEERLRKEIMEMEELYETADRI